MDLQGHQTFSILKYQSTATSHQDDQLTVEEPLEIQLDYVTEGARQRKSISITMRTPGNDEALALGFLFTEGIIKHRDEVTAIRTTLHTTSGSIIEVRLAPQVTPPLDRLHRNFYTTSSCGVCGKASIDAVFHSGACRVPLHTFGVSPTILLQLSQNVKQQQSLFQITGGIHGAALFDATGQVLLAAEDVGRHNAVDKLIGQSLTTNLDRSRCGIFLSGRISFELVQKSLMAGIPFMAAVGAPSTLAIELAQDANMTVVGFLKATTFNSYCGQQRIKS